MTRLAFIGGGGFAKEVLEIAELTGRRVVAYVGDSPGILQIPYWGAKEALLSRRTEFDAVAVAFGSTDRKSTEARRSVIDWIRTSGFAAEALISPNATLAKGVRVDSGVFVAHGVVVSVDADIRSFAVLNTHATIGHDAEIGENTTIAPGAFIGGASVIGPDSLVGPGANVLQGLTVGARVVVGVGASVVRSVGDGATVWPLRSKVAGPEKIRGGG